MQGGTAGQEDTDAQPTGTTAYEEVQIETSNFVFCKLQKIIIIPPAC